MAKVDIKTTFLKNTREVLRRAITVLWFMPLYTAGVLVLGQAIIKLDRFAGLWWIGKTFMNSLLFAGLLYYGLVLTYLAFTKRTWVPNKYVRFSVQYLFKLGGVKYLKRFKMLPAYLCSALSSFTYLFFIVLPAVMPLKGHIPAQTPEQQHLIAMACALCISVAIGFYITHKLLRVHFIKLHCMHELGK